MKTIVHQCLRARRRMRKCRLGVVSVSCPAQEMHVGPSKARVGEPQRQLRLRSKFANDSTCLCSLGNGIFSLPLYQKKNVSATIAAVAAAIVPESGIRATKLHQLTLVIRTTDEDQYSA